MTTAVEKSRQAAARIRHYLQIDGLKYRLWDQRERPGTDGEMTGADPPGGHAIEDRDLLALWRMDEYHNSADAVDETGNGHTGAQSGTPNVVAGPIGNSRNFTDPEHLVVSQAARLERQTFTISGWIRINAFWGTPATIIRKKRGVAAYSWTLDLIGATSLEPSVSLYFTDASTLTASHGSDLSQGPLYHIGATWDGTTLSLYVNGVLSTTATASGKTILYNTDDIHIGGSPDAAVYSIGGQIDDLALCSAVKNQAWMRRIASSADYSRPGIACVELPGSESTFGLDLKSMICDSGSMTFKLRNLRDPTDRAAAPPTYYFAKLFAPGIPSQADVANTTIRRPAAGEEQLEADATTIYVQDNTDFEATGGEAFIGQETFSYTGKGTHAQTGFGAAGQTIDTFTGVSKGIWPAVRSANRGRCYPYPRHNDELAGDIGRHHIVASKPYSLIGREVGWYSVAWDPSAGEIFDDGNAQLIWAGRIVTEAAYNPDTDTWDMGAESLLKDLERKIMRRSPRLYVEGINLNGEQGRKFEIRERGPGLTVESLGSFEIPKGYYTANSLAQAICDEINTTPANWTAISGVRPNIVASKTIEGGVVRFRFVNISVGGAADFQWVISPGFFVSSGGVGLPAARFCHAFTALGFPEDSVGFWTLNFSSGGLAEWEGSSPTYYHYQPLGIAANGGKLRGYWKGNDQPWDDQGDYGSLSVAWFAAGEALQAVTAKAATTLDDTRPAYEYTVAEPDPARPVFDGAFGFAGSEEWEDPLVFRQVLLFNAGGAFNKFRGPLELHLFNLLSSGTTDFNDSTYDKAPFDLAVDFPTELLDFASVLKQDAAIKANYSLLAKRARYIVRESTSWIDLWQREAMLWGVALCWDAVIGKLVCKSIIDPATHLTSTTIDESQRVPAGDYPRVSVNVEHVINQWKLKILSGDQSSFDKPGLDLTYNDVESQYGLSVTQGITIEHPGLRATTGSAQEIGKEILDLIFTDRELLFRYAHQKVTVRLAPRQAGRVGIGDAVIYASSDKHPDPLGSGLMNVSSGLVALVLSTSHRAQDNTTTSTLLIFSHFDVAALLRPYAQAALVDLSATNGGWDSATKQLTLIAQQYGEGAEPDDGSVYDATDAVLVIESAAEDPTAPQSWGPFDVRNDYETDGAEQLTLEVGATMAGWDPLKEHRVVSADYDDCTTDQQTRTTHQASAQTHKLGAALDDAGRYG